MRSAFAVLQVAENVSDEILSVVYKRLALLNHPDRAESPAAKEKAETQLKEINWAYGILSDPEKRREHLRELAPPKPPPRRPRPPPRPRYEDPFGGPWGFGGFRDPPREPRPDQETKFHSLGGPVQTTRVYIHPKKPG